MKRLTLMELFSRLEIEAIAASKLYRDAMATKFRTAMSCALDGIGFEQIGCTVYMECPSRDRAKLLHNLFCRSVRFGILDEPLPYKCVFVYPGGRIEALGWRMISERGMKIENQIFGGGSNTTVVLTPESYRVLGNLYSDKPRSLVDLTTDDQVWVNQALCDLIGKPPAEAVALNVRAYWQDDALEIVKRTLRQQQRLTNHRYEAQLNESTLARLQSDFELVEFDGRPHRLVTIHEAEAIATACV